MLWSFLLVVSPDKGVSFTKGDVCCTVLLLWKVLCLHLCLWFSVFCFFKLICLFTHKLTRKQPGIICFKKISITHLEPPKKAQWFSLFKVLKLVYHSHLFVKDNKY